MLMNKMISDRYMLVTSLGEGGMADVYLAIDTILNREVAIKILRGELSSDPVTLLRFQREANAASKLNHPNVVDVYDVGESEGRHYIVMEYVRGRTLKQLISQRGALDKEEAVDIMIQLTSAVQHAHENNIIHRDIKPQNVLVKDDGTVKITDFGIALAHDAVQLTQSDAVLGSAHYLAPETTRGEQATNQIDIYALGIVFYELLRGSVPFKGDNPVQIAMKHLREEIPSIRAFNPTLPQSIENIITKATVKNRSLRYPSAKAMLEDLKICLRPEYANVKKLILEEAKGEPTVIMGDVKESRSSRRKEYIEEEEEQPEPKKSHTKIIAAVLAIIAALCATGAILYFSGMLDFLFAERTITVPNVMDITKEEALAKLTNAGFDEKSITFKEALSDDAEDGIVFETNPKIGEEAKKSEGVVVSISKGNYFKMKNYSGMDITAVKDELEAALPKIKITTEKVPTNGKTVGTILEQSGEDVGTKLDPTKTYTMHFKVASEPEINISGIIGMEINTAAQKLRDMGAAVVVSEKLTVGMSEEELANIEKGVVIDVDPAEGTTYVQSGSNVITLYYYK